MLSKEDEWVEGYNLWKKKTKKEWEKIIKDYLEEIDKYLKLPKKKQLEFNFPCDTVETNDE